MRATVPTTVAGALARAVERLRRAGSPTPRLDAEVLLAHAVRRDRAWILAHPEAPLSMDAAGVLDAVLSRRAAGEPIAYIRGFKEWLSLRIRTDARALIPRPETEVLALASIDEIERRLETAATVTAWEVATGSGAVSVALALRFREELAAGRLTLIATDISADALALAAENLSEHGVDGLVRIGRADLLDHAGDESPTPDVVVANLPYLSTAEVEAAAGSLAFEPRVAVDAGPDGLSVLRRLFQQLPGRAARGATALLEVAMGQADAVASLAPRRATTDAVPDLAGIPRVVIVRLPETS